MATKKKRTKYPTIREDEKGRYILVKIGNRKKRSKVYLKPKRGMTERELLYQVIKMLRPKRKRTRTVKKTEKPLTDTIKSIAQGFSYPFPIDKLQKVEQSAERMSDKAIENVRARIAREVDRFKLPALMYDGMPDAQSQQEAEEVRKKEEDERPDVSKEDRYGRDRVAELHRYIERREIELREIENKAKERQEDIAKMNRLLDDVQTQAKQALKDKNVSFAEKEVLQKEFENMKITYDAMRSEYAKLTRELKEKKEEINESSEKLKDIKQRVEQAEKQIKQEKKMRESLEEVIVQQKQTKGANDEFFAWLTRTQKKKAKYGREFDSPVLSMDKLEDLAKQFGYVRPSKTPKKTEVIEYLLNSPIKAKKGKNVNTVRQEFEDIYKRHKLPVPSGRVNVGENEITESPVTKPKQKDTQEAEGAGAPTPPPKPAPTEPPPELPPAQAVEPTVKPEPAPRLAHVKSDQGGRTITEYERNLFERQKRISKEKCPIFQIV